MGSFEIRGLELPYIGAYRSYDKAWDGNESNETNPTTDLLNSL